MVFAMKHCLFFSSLLIVLANADTVPFITKCKADDKECLKESTKTAIPEFVKGLPEYNVETLDPMHHDNIDSSSSALKLLLDDVTVTGMGACVPSEVIRDVKEGNIYVKMLCDATLDAHYDMNGHLLLLSLSGNGAMHVDLRKAEFELSMNYVEEKGEDDKMHWIVKNWDYEYELMDNSTVHFENLRSDTDELTEAAERIVAERGNDIIHEVGTPVLSTILKRLVENIAHFFKVVPAEDLALD